MDGNEIAWSLLNQISYWTFKAMTFLKSKKRRRKPTNNPSLSFINGRILSFNAFLFLSLLLHGPSCKWLTKISNENRFQRDEPHSHNELRFKSILWCLHILSIQLHTITRRENKKELILECPWTATCHFHAHYALEYAVVSWITNKNIEMWYQE